ncbi:MAG TPA: hypothetical protein VJK03_05035 [Candidatus Nanoarchaeia archaeon]|nr:hypothetical protein [Candidatus Nanoarchaeia archaeon]
MNNLVKRLKNLSVTDKDAIWSTDVSEKNQEITVFCKINDNVSFKDELDLLDFLKKRSIAPSIVKEVTYEHYSPYTGEYEGTLRLGAYNVTFPDKRVRAFFYGRGYEMVCFRPSLAEAPFGSFG